MIQWLQNYSGTGIHGENLEKAELENEIPIGRMATPEEAARFIYTIFDSGSYLTGQVISFDGAWI